VAYESLGVREYWLIDPDRELVNFFHLGPDGRYAEFRPDMAGRMRSRTLKGFVLDIDLIWNRVLPTTAEVVGMVQGMMSGR
jgi:Uma2 family endonuclease